MLSGVFFDWWEWFTLPLYIFIVFILAYQYQRSKVEDNPLYRFYAWGLLAHIGGALVLGIIYEYYYMGGDTFGYFLGATNMDKLLFHSPVAWFKNEFGPANPLNYSLFTEETGFPLPYMYYDPRTYMVIRFINLLMIPAFNSYLLATVITAWFFYIGMWKLFIVFARHYPNIEKELAIAILFFPSVLFWSAGILKDSITLSATGWATYAIYSVFILKKNRVINLVSLTFSLFLIISIKPYIIFALLPGSLMWIFSQKIYTIKNAAAKFLIIPLIVALSGVMVYYALSNLGGLMDKFSIQKVMTTAAETQRDLKQSYYQGHTFDIGLEDASAAGFIKKFPQAFVAGTYRPFIWESDSIVMLLSGLENTFILLLSLYILVKGNIFNIFRRLFREPLLFFTFTYSVFFAFFVGLTTANFGALVRFKTAYLPFFIASLFILYKGQLAAKSDDELLQEA